ncbi:MULTISPECIES: methyltransferase [Streptomyces]|uniref:methyltransferase n=1 Tax=Streptomyces TaxID=1883 RepID=UPI0021A60D8F|nr:methyltransferase [Streptomyces atratus]MCT2543359.1 methyltransferase [Streptomyces atratus]
MIPEPARKLIRRHHDAETLPSSFSMFGRDWDLVPDVFAPVYDLSTALFTAWLPLARGTDLLEVGCGTGVTSVMAALRGCPRVTALDINPAAVRNTARNVRRHAVDDRVRVLESDLFARLPADDRYDVVYWNSSFVDAPVDRERLSALEAAVIDPGYETHERFLAQACRHLNPGGRIFLGFSTLGNRARLDELAAVHDIVVRTHRASGGTGSANVTYQLLEIRKGSCRDEIERKQEGRGFRASRR